MERTRVWLAVSPVVAAGVLLSHALAYRLTGTPSAPLHTYLEHGPQILLVLALAGLALAGLGARPGRPSAWPFPVAAVAAFAVQEHLERFAHTGELPAVVTSPAFLVGLILQVPVALAAWALARVLLGALEEYRSPRPTLPRVYIALLAPACAEIRRIRVRPLPGRGPPSLLRR